MASQGYAVTMIERNPLMASLLNDAMQRLSQTAWAQDNPVMIPDVITADALEALSGLSSSADCLYLDPMFPPKRKKSAAVNKQMKLLQHLVGEDKDATELLEMALSYFSRVAVKRPDYAEPLLRAPDERFSSKLVHYDVYFA